MSNEAAIDWFARNVHEWPSRDEVAHCWPPSGIGLPEYILLSKDQWLASRAELQNKPSWADAPEWANYLSQDKSGSWWFFRSQPSSLTDVWNNDDSAYHKNSWIDGSVLGDWRDTLEKRPKEFKSFTSIEDNQEQGVKRDSGWFERGELPPVGARVNVSGAGLVYGDGEKDCEVLTHVEDTAVVRMSYGLGCFQAHVMSPSMTERELAIEHMQSDIAERWANCEELAKHLIDKGWTKVAE